jgi:hypothetical protein
MFSGVCGRLTSIGTEKKDFGSKKVMTKTLSVDLTVVHKIEQMCKGSWRVEDAVLGLHREKILL